MFKKALGFAEETLPSLSDVKDSFAFDFIWAKMKLFPEILCDSAKVAQQVALKKKNPNRK